MSEERKEEEEREKEIVDAMDEEEYDEEALTAAVQDYLSNTITTTRIHNGQLCTVVLSEGGIYVANPETRASTRFTLRHCEVGEADIIALLNLLLNIVAPV